MSSALSTRYCQLWSKTRSKYIHLKISFYSISFLMPKILILIAFKLTKLIENLQNQLVAKGKEINDFREKYNIRYNNILSIFSRVVFSLNFIFIFFLRRFQGETDSSSKTSASSNEHQQSSKTSSGILVD